VQAEFARRSGGTILPIDDLRSLVDQLDEALLLDSERFRAEIARVLDEYRSAPDRPAALAGGAYPAAPDALAAFLREMADGVATRSPPAASKTAPRAVAAPHLDLRYGGRAALRVLADLAETFEGGTVVVFGVGHSMGRMPYALTGQDFATPIGTVPADRDLLDRVVGKTGDWVFTDELAHRNEHSVEFAAVLLRHVLGDRELRILPVLCGSFAEFVRDGLEPETDPRVDVFLETLREEAGDALLYASVDLAHMGPYYGDPRPLVAADLERIEREDREMLDRVAARDARGLFDHLHGCADRRRVCGSSALYSLLRVLPEGTPGDLIAYEQPVFPSEGNTVSICSIRWS
jgi:AmmeMemoRadiSam system protein B